MCCRRRDWLTSAGRPGGKQRAQRDRVISCGCTIDCDAPLDQALADPHVGRAIDRHHAFDHILIEKQCRSEEHTSELQSLMRTSYAVFCMKKKKTTAKSHDIYKHQ